VETYFKNNDSVVTQEDISLTLQYSLEWVSLVAILLPLRISQEQGVWKETMDNGGFEKEHQGQVAAVFPTMLQWVMQNFQKRLRECVNKGRHLTDTVFRKWILKLKCFEIKIILVINSCKKIVYFSFQFNLKIVRFFCRTLYKPISKFRQRATNNHL
jgi:hypothetical protein